MPLVPLNLVLAVPDLVRAAADLRLGGLLVLKVLPRKELMCAKAFKDYSE